VIVPHQVPLRPLPPIELDELAKSTLSKPNLIGEEAKFSSGLGWIPVKIQSGIPYQIKALLLYRANLLYNFPPQQGFTSVLEKIPFIVSFSPFLDETTKYADYILPDHTYLEKWQDDSLDAPLGFPVFGLRQPVVAPLYDTRNTGDVLIEIAKGMGGSLASAFPWPNFLEAIRYQVEGIFETERGSIIEPISEEAWVKKLAERGWRVPSYQTRDEFWDQLQKSGGWWDYSYEFQEYGKALKTLSGKFEFYSLALKEEFLKLRGTKTDTKLAEVWNRFKIQARGDAVFMPHYEPVKLKGEEYPFSLYLFRLLSLSEERNANQPFLQEISGVQVQLKYTSWVEINPQNASDLKISDEDLVWVESPFGKIKLKAKVTPGTIPKVLCIPLGFGHEAYGQWAQDLGANPLKLLPPIEDGLLPDLNLFTTKVKVYRA